MTQVASLVLPHGRAYQDILQARAHATNMHAWHARWWRLRPGPALRNMQGWQGCMQVPSMRPHYGLYCVHSLGSVRPQDVRIFSWVCLHACLACKGAQLTVSGNVVRGGGNLLYEARSNVLELVLELDGLRDGHAVLRDLGATIGLLDHDVPALEVRSGRIKCKYLAMLLPKAIRWTAAGSEQCSQPPTLGPSVTCTASASLFTPANTASRHSMPNLTSLAYARTIW
jgi:hypothetical protein